MYMKKNILLSMMLCFLGFTGNLFAQKLGIVPNPVSIKESPGMFKFNEKTKVIHAATLKNEGQYLVELLKNTGLPFSALELSAAESYENSVVLTYDKTIKDEEGYSLVISAKNIQVKGATPAGVFMGIQTLRQMLPVEIENLQFASTIKEWALPALTIKDGPRFNWRGMHLDVARHFFSLAYLKKFIDNMSVWKFNRLHLHLTDDQGWRLEIKKYPLLTSQGAWRRFNDQDSVCIEKAITNSAFKIPSEFIKKEGSDEVYGGFYTQEEMRSLIQYAKERHIEILPEIDMPGHFMAAIKTNPGLACAAKPAWGKVFSAPLCAGNDSVYKFVEDILSEVTALFPYEYIHIGADEVEKAEWQKCSKCQAVIQREGLKNEHELQTYFVRKIEAFLLSKGKKMIGWDEIVDGGLTKDATVMYWRGWEKNAVDKALKAGNNVIFCPTTHCYFDYAQTSETLKKMYEYDPVVKNLNPKFFKQIMGIQANLWSEYIPTSQRLEYMAFPRMIALADAAWSAKKGKSWEVFKQKMQKQFARLNAMGINYYLPEPSGPTGNMVFLDKKSIELSSSVPEGIIRYTTDGSEPNANSTVYSKPLTFTESVTLKSKVFAGSNSSETKVNLLQKGKMNPAVKVNGLKNGLKYSYYEADLKNTGEIEFLTPANCGITTNFTIPKLAQPDAFGLKIWGYLKVPADGIYTFYTTSDDGSKLFIDGHVVVDNDGAHGEKQVNGQVALKAGLHEIKLLYFEMGGGETLQVHWEYKGKAKSIISPLLLFKQ
jgi:hexosaminidase